MHCVYSASRLVLRNYLRSVQHHYAEYQGEMPSIKVNSYIYLEVTTVHLNQESPTRRELRVTYARRHYFSAITFHVKPLATSPSYAAHTSCGISWGIWKSISGVA